jgi:hypothetical protein
MNAISLIEVLMTGLREVFGYSHTIGIEIILLNEWMNRKLIYYIPSHMSLHLLILLNSRFSSLSLGGSYLFFNCSLIVFKILFQATSSPGLRYNFMLYNLFWIVSIE